MDAEARAREAAEETFRKWHLSPVGAETLVDLMQNALLAFASDERERERERLVKHCLSFAERSISLKRRFAALSLADQLAALPDHPAEEDAG